MKLYIMRHGDAVPAQALQADKIRPLSTLGEQEVLANAQWLQSQAGEAGVDWTLVSPYIRAQQTATILHSVVTSQQQSSCDDITPESDAETFVSWLGAQLQKHPCQQVVVVSHMPFVSYAVAAIDPRIQPPIFPTAGIAVLEFDPHTLSGKLERLMIVDRCA